MSEWYCKIANQTLGPLSLDELRFLQSRGKLSPDDLVREASGGDWTRATMEKRLFPESPMMRTNTTLNVVSATTPIASSVNETSVQPNAGSPAHVTQPPKASLAFPPTRNTPPAANPANAPDNGPTEEQSRQRREQIMIGAAVGLGIILLILLLLLLLRTLLSAGGGSPGQGEGGSGVGQGDGNQVAGNDAPSSNGQPSNPNQNAVGKKVDRSISPPSPPPPPPSRITMGAFAVSVEKKDEMSTPPQPSRPVNEFFADGRTGNSRGRGAGSGTGSGGEGGGTDNGSGRGRGDELSDRLNREGARGGDVQISLMWNNINDIDLHVYSPSGERIWYKHRNSRCGGTLDVDMNARGNFSSQPVENIFWPTQGAPHGEYTVFVHHFRNNGGRDPTSYSVTVKYGKGRKRVYRGMLTSGGQSKQVCKFKQ